MHVNIDKEAGGDIRQRCLELAGDDAELMFLDNFDEAIVGVGEVGGNPPVVVYDAKAVLAKLTDQLADPAEAQAYYDNNIADAFVGTGMPVLLSKLP